MSIASALSSKVQARQASSNACVSNCMSNVSTRHASNLFLYIVISTGAAPLAQT